MARLQLKTATQIGDLSKFGRIIESTIDQEDIGVLIDITVNKTYSQKQLAVVREYGCNALDAHRYANKVNVPFEVTCPTTLSPSFKVRDFGFGMDVEEIEKIYVKLGRSTKRESDDQVGCYGIGAKSAFCYGDSFLITSWKHGTCSKYLAHMDEQKRLRFVHISSEPSTEPSGMEIEVAVRNDDINIFKKHILEVFRYFPTFPIIKGMDEEIQIPQKFIEGKNWFITGDKYEYQSYYNAKLHAIVGNVSYKVDLGDCNCYDKCSNAVRSLSNVCMVFTTDEVDIPPSRETLEYTEKTKKAIIQRSKEIQDEITKIVADKIETAKDIFEAKDFIPNFVNNKDVYYKGLNIQEFFQTFINSDKVAGVNVEDNAAFYLRNSSNKLTKRQGASSYLNKYVFIVFSNTNDSKVSRRIAAIGEKYPKASFIAVIDDSLERQVKDALHYEVWPKENFLRLSDFEPVKVIRTSSGSRSQVNDIYSVEVCESNRRGRYWDRYYFFNKEAAGSIKDNPDLIESEDEKIYMPMKNGGFEDKDRLNVFLNSGNKDFFNKLDIYGVRSLKVAQLNDKWITLWDYIKREAQNVLDSFTEEELKLINTSFPTNKYSAIDREDFNKIKELMDKKTNAVSKFNKHRAIITLARQFFPSIFKTDSSMEAELQAILGGINKKYPLLKYISIDNCNISDILHYIDLINANNKGE